MTGSVPPGDATPPAPSGFVRAARASDAPGLARIQIESWRSSLDGLVPADVLAELGSSEASEQFTERWRDAIVNPPTSKHRVHVAVDPDTPGPGVGGGSGGSLSGGTAGLPPIGFASAGPATDDDKWPATDGELYELHVLPAADAAGHGARLLHAVADTLAEDGFQTVCTWALSDDAPRLEFLESAGWAPDGARSNLDMGVKVQLVRLHTRLLLARRDGHPPCTGAPAPIPWPRNPPVRARRQRPPPYRTHGSESRPRTREDSQGMTS